MMNFISCCFSRRSYVDAGACAGNAAADRVEEIVGKSFLPFAICILYAREASR